MVGLGRGEKTGNCEINCKLHSMCVVWVKTGTLKSPVVQQRTLGAAETAFGSLSPWFTETGVGLQLGLGNTHLKAGTHFFTAVPLGRDRK